jgi:pimeloyl-ACP methyl ester carboxylesterase
MSLDMAERYPDRVEKMVLMGSPGVGMTITDGLKALRAYKPSPENMPALLLDYFAVDKSIITDDLVRIRYEASVETFDAYRAMFTDPWHKGNRRSMPRHLSRILALSLTRGALVR